MTAASGLPARFPVPFANAAGSNFITGPPLPTGSQTGGHASLTDGFPPLTMTPETLGGVPPFGQDFNGILKQLSQWAQWQAMGGPLPWDATFSTNIGGYPAGAIVASGTTANLWWLSLVDNNTSNPDAGGANWQAYPDAIGTVKMFAGATAPQGWVLCQGQVVAQAGTYARLFTAIGTAYNTGGEGAGNFRLPDLRARGPFGLDPGNATGRITAAGGNYDASALGNAGGQQNQALTSVAQLAAHTHTGPVHSHAITGQTTGPDNQDHTHNFTAPNTPTLQGGTTGGEAVTGGVGATTGGRNQQHNHTLTGVTDSAGGGATGSVGSGSPFAVLSPGQIVNFIIKY